MAASGDISVQYLRSEDQHADILTKAIGRESFERHREFFLGNIIWFTGGSYYKMEGIYIYKRAQ